MIHPLLGDLFAHLDTDGVRWCLLRLPAVPEAPTGDVDVLVSPSDLLTFQRIAQEHGFVPVPGWDSAPTLLMMALDRPTGRFLLLEVTDRIVFGHGLATGHTATVLGRTRGEDGVRLPGADDEFWLLVLHCLLDTGAVPDKYRERLRSLAPGAVDDGELGRVVTAHAPPAWSAHRVRTSAERGEWGALTTLAPQLAEWWRRDRSPRQRRADVAARARRRLRAPALLPRRYGVSVALLGPNGAGKSTLRRAIEESWPLPVDSVYMGLWKSGDGSVREHPVVAPLLRVPTAWSRWLRGTSSRLRGRLVVYDRYVHDARIPPAPPLVTLKRAYFSVLARSVPDADVVVVLTLPAEVAHERKPEDSLESARREEAEYRLLGSVIPRAVVVDAARPAAEVRTEVLATLWDRTLARWRALPSGPVRPVPPAPADGEPLGAAR